MSDERRPAIEIADVPELRRFEARLDGRLAGVAQYVRRGTLTVFVHTEVIPAFEGRGVGSSLARGALAQVRAAGGTVEPRCPFFAAYIRRHPEEADLVAGAGRGAAPDGGSDQGPGPGIATDPGADR